MQYSEGIIRGKNIENYLQNSRADTAVDRIRSKSKEDRTFAPKQNNHFCPMTRQSYIYLCTLMVTKADVQAFMAERSEYTKANRFEDIEVKVYI